jgi:hypothetical protein
MLAAGFLGQEERHLGGDSQVGDHWTVVRPPPVMFQVDGEGVGPIDQRVVAGALAQVPLKVVTPHDPLIGRGQRFREPSPAATLMLA